MRVALLCPYSLDVPGGVATHVLGLAEWLVGQHQDVVVLAPGHDVLGGSRRFELEALGPSAPVRFNGSVARLALLPGQVRRAREIARAADVVHVHEPLTPGIAFAVARHSPRLVVTHHAAYSAPEALSHPLRLAARLLPERVSIAVSRAAAETCRALTGEPCRIIPNAVPMPSPPPRLRAGSWRGGARPRVAFLGRLDEPRKGFRLFLELARESRSAGLDADFIAIGPGISGGEGVHTLGAVSDDERLRLLRTVDVLVAPNTGGESFGLVLVEAMAAGCDVVASDLPAFEAVIREAGVGSTFRTGDVDAARVALQRSLSDPLDPSVAHTAATRWGWDRVGPELLAILRERASLDAIG